MKELTFKLMFHALRLAESCAACNPLAAFPSRPVFIVGAPRSGSTFLYQYLATQFEVGYFSNCHNRYFPAPALAERLFRPRYRGAIGFSSELGRTRNAWDPAEGGAFFGRFFPRDLHYDDTTEVDDEALQRFRCGLVRLTQACGASLLLKNLFCSLRLIPIRRYIPEACFVVIERDPEENARSLLHARRSAYGDDRIWWSVRPRSCLDVDHLTPLEQTRMQVREINLAVARDLASVPQRDIFHVHYDRLKEAPGDVAAGFAQFVVAAGVSCQPRGTAVAQAPSSQHQAGTQPARADAQSPRK